MLRFCVRRTLLAVPTLLAVATLVFLVIRVLPGDPAQAMLGEYATAQAVVRLREQMGLDRPLIVQYFEFVIAIARGDLGRSLINNKPIAEQIVAAFPYTLQLTLAGIGLGILMGVPTGTLTALKRNAMPDYVGRVLSLIGLSIPSFYLGILLLILFSLKLNWFPMVGAGEPGDLVDQLHHLFLPALSLGLLLAAYLTRVTRSSVLEVLREDYVRTARAKGVRERLVVYKHAVRNALIPIVTVIGIYVGLLLGGSVLVEVVFSRPGLGKLLVGSMTMRDYVTVQSTLVVFAGVIVVVNLAVDLLYGLIDPRVRYD
jgi:ABC-type dipeptide/oligopeptide/nickel transport system permease component